MRRAGWSCEVAGVRGEGNKRRGSSEFGIFGFTFFFPFFYKLWIDL